jgi:transcription initiation factor TFIIE subunit alpha
VAQVAGTDVVPLVKILKNKKNVSEFKLAEAMKQEVNTTRNMLYRLYNSNLVSFIRKKDKKKGWYIYYWTFDMKRIKELLWSLKKKRLEMLKERLGREEEGQFYLCPNECMRLDFDQAMNFQFKCPECGQLIHIEDNTARIEAIKKEIATLEKELAEREIVKVVVKKVKKKKAKAKKKKKAKAKKKISKKKKKVKARPKKRTVKKQKKTKIKKRRKRR